MHLVHMNVKMVVSIVDNGKMASNLVKAYTFGKMDPFMKDGGKIMWPMEKDV